MTANKDTRETNNKKLLRLMKTPAKVLTKARDLYIHSLIGCAGQVSYGTVMGCPTGQFSTVPRSSSSSLSRSTNRYTTTTAIAAATTTTTTATTQKDSDQVETKSSTRQEQQQQQQQQVSAVITRNSMPRSFSLGVIGRIDEERPYCEFDEDDDLPVATDVLLRSSSCCFKMNWI